VVEAAGAGVVVCNSGADVNREQRHLHQLEERRVRGVLITPVDGRHDGHVDDLVRRGIPVVLVDRGSGRLDCCSVAVDDVLGGRLVGEHLRLQGHERVAFVGDPTSFTQVADRLAGFESTVDGGVQGVIVTGNLTVAAGREAGAKIAALPGSVRPTAVFCANDQIALGVLQEMTLRGLRVPSDTAIVGYDDIYFAAVAGVPLSSVRQPREQLGRTAAELLLEEVNDPGGHQHRHVIFKPELVVRESSGRAAHHA
jgi:LacI family transcriptional regulator